MSAGRYQAHLNAATVEIAHANVEPILGIMTTITFAGRLFLPQATFRAAALRDPDSSASGGLLALSQEMGTTDSSLSVWKGLKDSHEPSLVVAFT